jgi:hypothetical protein
MPAGPTIDSRFARMVAHPLRQRLISAYTAETTSPSKLAAGLGEPVNLVSYHTGVLLRAACLELVRTEKRRGATEHFYRATMPPDIEDRDWEQLPTPLRRLLVRRLLEDQWRDAVNALPCGGMDDSTAHVSRSFMRLDGQGRSELAALLRATVLEARRIEAASRARDDAAARPAELVVLSFAPASAP